MKVWLALLILYQLWLLQIVVLLLVRRVIDHLLVFYKMALFILLHLYTHLKHRFIHR